MTSKESLMKHGQKTRHIPKKIAKKVREASGFRCAWCGCYLTERHHIYPYSKGGTHTEDNLILLCPNCHTQTHSGNISVDELMKRRKSLTGKVDRASGCLSINKEYFQVDVGGNHFINCANILMFNDIPLISVKNDKGYLLLSLRLFNEEGNLICWMSENRWWLENEAILDFKYTRNEFLIIDSNSSKVLELKIKENIIEIYGSIPLLGDIIQLSKDKIVFKITQNAFINNTFHSIHNAIVLKEKSFNKPTPESAGILIEV